MILFQLFHIMMLSWCAVALLHPELIQQQEDLLLTQPENISPDNNYSNTFGTYDWMKNKDLTGGKA